MSVHLRCIDFNNMKGVITRFDEPTDCDLSEVEMNCTILNYL